MKKNDEVRSMGFGYFGDIGVFKKNYGNITEFTYPDGTKKITIIKARQSNFNAPLNISYHLEKKDCAEEILDLIKKIRCSKCWFYSGKETILCDNCPTKEIKDKIKERYGIKND